MGLDLIEMPSVLENHIITGELRYVIDKLNKIKDDLIIKIYSGFYCHYCSKRSHPVDEEGNDLTGIDRDSIGDSLDHSKDCIVTDLSSLIQEILYKEA